MKAYVDEEHQNNQKDQKLNQDEFFENIDSVKENDEENHDDQFMYNLDINSSSICKKCDAKRKTFKSNNVFHNHIRDCTEDERTNLLEKQKSKDLLIVKSQIKFFVQREYDFRSY
jgi:hypothetical protein